MILLTSFIGQSLEVIKSLVLFAFSQKPDNLIKIALFQTSKIGLNKHLFKNKKSAINAEILKMVRVAVQLSGLVNMKMNPLKQNLL